MSLIHTPVWVIGGQGGSAFSFDVSRSGQVLRRIGVWAGGWFLAGIRVWMTGSSSPVMFGRAEGSYQEYEFRDGERITRLSLWGNGAGTRSGGIRFETSTGGRFFHHMTSWGLQQEFPIDVASGLCVGFMGRHGHHIDSVGFMFLRPIASARMINVRYPTLDLETAGIVPVTLDSFSDSNNAATISKDWRFHGSREVTISSSWSLTSGIEVHATLTVTAGFPMVAEVQGEYGWAVSVTGNHTSTHEESRVLGWDQSGTLLPGQWISIQATTRRGTITLPYQATMEITLDSGTVFQYAISSLYSGVDFTSVQISNTGTRDDSRDDQVIEPKLDQDTATIKNEADTKDQAKQVQDTGTNENEADTKDQAKQVQECKLVFSC